MNIQVGDYVAWWFKDRLTPDYTSVVFVDNQRLFKGYATKIKTHDFFFFKRDYPLYKVDGVWVRRVKPVKIIYAEIDKPCSNPDCITICYDCCSA